MQTLYNVDISECLDEVFDLQREWVTANEEEST